MSNVNRLKIIQELSLEMDIDPDMVIDMFYPELKKEVEKFEDEGIEEDLGIESF